MVMEDGVNRMRTGHEALTDVPVREQPVNLDMNALFSSERRKKVGRGEYAHIDGIMKSVFQDVMLNPDREKKYRTFLSGAFQLDKLWRFAGLPMPEHRFRAFVLTYAQQRLFDDVVDGDTPIRLHPEDRVMYADARLAALESSDFDEKDPVDAFAIKILDDIHALDPAYVESAKRRLGEIMRSISFDARRIRDAKTPGTWKLFSRDELESHFFDLDIEGVVGLTLFLFGFKDSQKNMELLAPLGEAARVAYNLKDFEDDLKARLCNIPREDAERLGITDESLRQVAKANGDVSRYPDAVREWLFGEIARGRKLLEEHSKQPIDELEPLYDADKLFTRIRSAAYRKFLMGQVFNLAYVLGARRTFNKMERDLLSPRTP